MKRILLTILLFQLKTSLTTSTCPKISGLSNPSQIISKYITSILSTMNISDEKTKIGLIYSDEQITELKVYRYIFKILPKSNRLYYIGILSLIKGEEILKENPKHEILRFIQTSDFRDAQRLLGNYEAKINDESGCDQNFLKVKFWKDFKENTKSYFDNENIGNYDNENKLDKIDLENVDMKDLEGFLKKVKNLYGDKILLKLLDKEKNNNNENMIFNNNNNSKILENNNFEKSTDLFNKLLSKNNFHINNNNNLLKKHTFQINTNLFKNENFDNDSNLKKNKIILHNNEYSNNLQNENFINKDPFLNKYNIPKFNIHNSFVSSNSNFKHGYKNSLIN